MRPIVGLLILCFTAFLTQQVTAQDFEGTITISSSKMDEGKMEISVKGDDVLMNISTPENDKPMKMLSNKKSQNMTMFMEDKGKKYALKMGPEMLAMIDQEEIPNTNKEEEVQIQVTKETKMIDGYKCIKITSKDKENEVVAWVTKDLGFNTFDVLPDFMRKASESGVNGAQAKIMQDYFLIEGTSKNLSTSETSQIKVSVEKKKIDDTIFNLNESEYQVYDMTDMMKMMMELQNDPEKMKEFEEVMKAFGNQ